MGDKLNAGPNVARRDISHRCGARKTSPGRTCRPLRVAKEPELTPSAWPLHLLQALLAVLAKLHRHLSAPPSSNDSPIGGLWPLLQASQDNTAVPAAPALLSFCLRFASDAPPQQLQDTSHTTSAFKLRPGHGARALSKANSFKATMDFASSCSEQAVRLQRSSCPKGHCVTSAIQYDIGGFSFILFGVCAETRVIGIRSSNFWVYLLVTSTT